MPETKIKTIEINYDLCGEGDQMDMITITRRQFREALAVCLAAFHRAGGCADEETNDKLTQMCGMFAAGLEYKLFGKNDEEEDQ